MSVVYAVEPVVLVREDSLCPNETSASFTCTTNGEHLFWILNGIPTYLDSSRLGVVERSPTHAATLLWYYDSGCISVLNIINTTVSDLTVVECHNGSDFTTQRIEYYHQIAGRCSLLLRACARDPHNEHGDKPLHLCLTP